jgi:DNA-binding NarL/FixJ family response regulator
MSEQTVKVFLVDDHEVVREGLAQLLSTEKDMEVVGGAGSSSQALRLMALNPPQVAVVDMRLGEDDGIKLCREIRSRFPTTACLVLTSYSDDEAFARAVLAGASGYVLKQIRGEELVSSIRKVAAGKRLFDPDQVSRAMAKLEANREAASLGAKLTTREREILELISLGKTNREIGKELYLAEKTIKNYVSNLLAKLGMTRRSEAAAYAARLAERKSN